MPQPEASTREVLAGLVERVTFHNAENGFCVLRIKARGHRELITVIGHAAVIAAGEWVTASGEWVNDRTHGQQFKSRFMRISAPTTATTVRPRPTTTVTRVAHWLRHGEGGYRLVLDRLARRRK